MHSTARRLAPPGQRLWAGVLPVILSAPEGVHPSDPSLLHVPSCPTAGALRPTLFCGVPRVFDRIYAGVMQKVRDLRWSLLCVLRLHALAER